MVVNLMVRIPTDAQHSVCWDPFLLFSAPQKGKNMKKQSKKKDVIAYRKTCQAKGTGLSHYILMDRKAK
jgi:modified peptide precursor CbpA